MRAVKFRDVGDFQIEDVPKPSLQAASDVLLKVTLGAICGSDLHIYHGHTPINPGAVIGHEFTGVIEEVGPEVRRFRAGDRVVASFFTACGHCYLCRRGWFAQCVDKGTFGHGEYFGNLGGGQAECVGGGGTISMVGVPSKTEWQFPIMQAWMKDLTFRAGWCNVQAYMRPLLDLVAAGRLQPERIISHRMRLEEAPEAYRMFDAREATKIVLTP